MERTHAMWGRVISGDWAVFRGMITQDVTELAVALYAP